MRPRLYSPVARIGVRPDQPANDPAAIVAPRPRGSRRPHTDARVESVRRLIVETTLTYGQIAARTGVGRASICRWTRDQGWQRPAFAPRATDTVRAPAPARNSSGARSPRASMRSPSAPSANWSRAPASISTSSPRRWSC